MLVPRSLSDADHLRGYPASCHGDTPENLFDQPAAGQTPPARAGE